MNIEAAILVWKRKEIYSLICALKNPWCSGGAFFTGLVLAQVSLALLSWFPPKKYWPFKLIPSKIITLDGIAHIVSLENFKWRDIIPIKTYIGHIKFSHRNNDSKMVTPKICPIEFCSWNSLQRFHFSFSYIFRFSSSRWLWKGITLR